MKKINTINLNEMFGLDPDEDKKIENEKQGTTEIELSQLVPFSNHPFKLYEGDRLDDMVQSIKEYGVITPLIVRKLEDDKYQILSGHNRANAAKMANLIKVPIVIKDDLTDEEAMLIVTETNLIQRSFSELSHSEKARILTERHSAIKYQGKRVESGKEISPERQRKIDIINEIEMLSNDDVINDKEGLGQIDPQNYTRNKIGNQYDLSPRAVSRYLRIDYLTNELKERLDNDEIPFMSAVDLSFLNESYQEIVETILGDYGYKIDLKKSEILKNYAQARNLNYDKAKEVLSGKYFNRPKKVKNFKLKPKLVNKFFKEDQTQKEIEEIIEIALELYFAQDSEEGQLES